MILFEEEQDGRRPGDGRFSGPGAPAYSLWDLIGFNIPGRYPPPRPHFLDLPLGPPVKTPPLPGEPGFDPDPGFKVGPGPSTAIPMPQQDAVDYSPYEKLGVDSTPSPGPAKASRFKDPKTGKFDYWGWLDAGMANLGKGGVLFEDDTPEIMERNAVFDKPAAMIAAGAPENHAMPEEKRFEAEKTGRNEDLLQPVAYKASAQTQEDGQPYPGQTSSTPTQPQSQEDQTQDYTQLPVSPEGWKLTPWGQGTNWKDNLPISPKDAPNMDPNTYDYPKVGEPPDTEEGRQIRTLIEKYAKEYGVPVQLLFNKAHVETGGTWNTHANSGKAKGLFQFTPKTGEAYGIKDPYNIEENVRAAAWYMSDLLKQSNGDPFIAEIGYNANPKHMWSNGALPNETYHHLQKVFPGQRLEYLWRRMPNKVISNPNEFWREYYK